MYQTRDLGVITALSMHGYEPVEVKKTPRGRGVEVWYLYEEDRNLLDLVDDYNDGILRVEAREFYDKTGEVKKEIFRHVNTGLSS